MRTIPLSDMVSRAVADREAAIIGEFTFSGTASPVTSYCTQIVEVEVDTETGQVRVERIVTAHDVGTVINPLTHQGQIEGGVIQGLGYALMEELGTEEGRISTLTLGDYKMPTMPDIPKLETVPLGVAVGTRALPKQGDRRKQQRPRCRGDCQRRVRRRGSADNQPSHHRGKGIAGAEGKRSCWLTRPTF